MNAPAFTRHPGAVLKDDRIERNELSWPCIGRASQGPEAANVKAFQRIAAPIGSFEKLLRLFFYGSRPSFDNDHLGSASHEIDRHGETHSSGSGNKNICGKISRRPGAAKINQQRHALFLGAFP